MCKHENGYLSEFVDTLVCFDVIDGVVAEEGDIVIGNISGYLYHCNDCGREWRWNGIPRLKWLQRIYVQLREHRG